MGARISSGFTIIETMLFLAVTGLLILGALLGTSASLNAQRYRDAVETFKTTLQDQYSALGSIQNNRADKLTCGTGAVVSPSVESTKGQTRCYIVGRFMVIRSDTITTYNVLAYARSTTATITNDLEDFKQGYDYNIDPDDISTTKMEWGTKIGYPVSGTGTGSGARNMSFLFIRSPRSGSIYTFTSDVAPADTSTIKSTTFTNMMVAGNSVPGQGNRYICVASDNLFVGGDTSIFIPSGAASASAIEVRSNQIIATTGATTRC